MEALLGILCFSPYPMALTSHPAGASGSSDPVVPKLGSATVAPSSTESTTGVQKESLTAEELRKRRQAYFDRRENPGPFFLSCYLMHVREMC